MVNTPLKKKKFGRLARLGEQPLHSKYKNEGGERFCIQKKLPPSFKRENSRRLVVFAPQSHFWLHFAFIFGVSTHSDK